MNRLIVKIIAGAVAVVLIVLAGVWLSLRRGDIAYTTLESRYANAASRYVDLPHGLHVHYRDQGNPTGPTVVLLHGFGLSLDTWEPWVRLLGRTYHIVTVDLPGFGLTRAPAGAGLDYDSDAAFVEAFAQARHLDRFVIGGSSMGGGVAWRYALAHPARVKGLILVDASGWPEPPVFDRSTFPANALGNPIGRAVLIDLDNTRSLRDGLRNAFADPSKADAAYVRKYSDLSRAPARRRQWLDILFGWEKQTYATPEALARIKAPTLILWGDQDHLIPLDSARRFVAAIPGSHLIVYPKVGHLPAEEAPEASAADVGAFLHQVDPPKKAAAAAGGPKPGIQAKKPEKNLLVFY